MIYSKIIDKHNRIVEESALKGTIVLFVFMTLLSLLASGVFVYWVVTHSGVINTSKVGGVMVGVSVLLQLFAQWFEYFPSTHPTKAPVMLSLAGPIALVGTLLWALSS